LIAATAAQQRRLLDLQAVDTAIRQLEHRRSHLPEQVALDDNAAELSQVSADYGNAVDQLERLSAQQKRHEDEVAAVDARRKSEEGRMYSGLITSEKEVEALRHEISSLRNRKNDLEDALLEIMEQREETESRVEGLKGRHAELTGQVAALTSARDEAASDIDAELEQRRAERGTVASELSAELLGHYDQLRDRKQGVAVAALQGRTCLGCRLELTAIEYEEAMASTDSALAHCEQCGRILVSV
jgi:uncharacterized protein